MIRQDKPQASSAAFVFLIFTCSLSFPALPAFMLASINDLGDQICNAAYNDHRKLRGLLQQLKDHRDRVAIMNKLSGVPPFR